MEKTKGHRFTRNLRRNYDKLRLENNNLKEEIYSLEKIINENKINLENSNNENIKFLNSYEYHKKEHFKLEDKIRDLDNKEIKKYLELYDFIFVSNWIYKETNRLDWKNLFVLNKLNGKDIIDLTKEDLKSIYINDIDECFIFIIKLRDIITRPIAHKLWQNNKSRNKYNQKNNWYEAQRLLLL